MEINRHPLKSSDLVSGKIKTIFSHLSSCHLFMELYNGNLITLLFILIHLNLRPTPNVEN